MGGPTAPIAGNGDDNGNNNNNHRTEEEEEEEKTSTAQIAMKGGFASFILFPDNQRREEQRGE